MTGRRRRAGDAPGELPLSDGDVAQAVMGLARQVERVQRAQAAQEQMLRNLAADVARLARTARPDPPLSWLLAGAQAGDDMAGLAAILNDLVTWVRDVYLFYPDARLAPCWLWHPGAVEELLWLRQYHREAYHPLGRSAAKAAEFHERFLPGVIKRLGKSLDGCDLTLHQPGQKHHRPHPITAPLADYRHRIATEWATQQIPDPAPAELNDAKTHTRPTHQQHSPR